MDHPAWLADFRRAVGTHGRTYWVAHEIFEVIDAPMAYSADRRYPSAVSFDQNTRH